MRKWGTQPYSDEDYSAAFYLWRFEGETVLRLSNTSDCHETIDFENRADIDALIERLTLARDELFPAGK